MTETTTMTEADLDRHAVEIAKDIIDRMATDAVSGDTKAATILLDRIWPGRDGRLVQFGFPEIKRAGDVGPAIDTAMRLAAEGVLTLREAKLLADLATARAAAFATHDVDEHIQRLEAATARMLAGQPSLRRVK